VAEGEFSTISGGVMVSTDQLVLLGIFPGFDPTPIILMLETAVVAFLLALVISGVGRRGQ
jgi:hypothetical protein